MENTRVLRGDIDEVTCTQKIRWLRNTFLHYFGSDTKSNAISDDQMQEFINHRLTICKRKTTVNQEISRIKHFYGSCLIKKGYASRVPELERIKITKKDQRSKRIDTFTDKEIEKLFL